MKLAEIQTHLEDLKKEYYAIGRTLNFDEWLTAQCMQLSQELALATTKIQFLEPYKERYEYAIIDGTDLRQKLEQQEELLNKEIGRSCALEEWLTEYRDQLKKENVFHKNEGVINAINELLYGDENI